MTQSKFIKVDNSPKFCLTKAALPESQKLTTYNILSERSKDANYRPGEHPWCSVQTMNKKCTVILNFINNSMLEKLDDRSSDILDYIANSLLAYPYNVGDLVEIDIDHLLSALGIKKKLAGNGRRGGYNKGCRQDIITKIEALSQIWITTQVTPSTIKRGQGKKAVTVTEEQQRLFSIAKRLILREDGKQEIDVSRLGLYIGTFFRQLLSSESFTTDIPTRLLQYHPRKQYIEKRVGKYFYRFLGAKKSHKVANLLFACHIYSFKLVDCEQEDLFTGMKRLNIEKKSISRPDKFRTRFLKALEQLKTDGVIANYKFLDEYPQQNLSFNDWLQSRIEITLPAR